MRENTELAHTNGRHHHEKLGEFMSQVQPISFFLGAPCSLLPSRDCEIKEIESSVPVSVIVCDLPSCHRQILQISRSWCLRRDDSRRAHNCAAQWLNFWNCAHPQPSSWTFFLLPPPPTHHRHYHNTTIIAFEIEGLANFGRDFAIYDLQCNQINSVLLCK